MVRAEYILLKVSTIRVWTQPAQRTSVLLSYQQILHSFRGSIQMHAGTHNMYTLTHTVTTASYRKCCAPRCRSRRPQSAGPRRSPAASGRSWRQELERQHSSAACLHSASCSHRTAAAPLTAVGWRRTPCSCPSMLCRIPSFQIPVARNSG